MSRWLVAAVLWVTAAAAADEPGKLLWQDPGRIEDLDFAGSVDLPLHPPQSPFTFLREDLSGTQTSIFVRDAAGVPWNLKFDFETKTEAFCWRAVRACGYFAEPSFYVAEGRIEKLKPLKRPTGALRADGAFSGARFQYRDPNWKFLRGRNWRWDFPPLAGTRELSGLKILITLFSNRDNGDARVGRRGGSNTGAFELREGRNKRLVYAFTNWGSGMGRWGPASGQNGWRCEDYAEQTPEFVKRVERGMVVFGWGGAIEAGFRDNIPPAHVAWLMQYLGRISGEQWRAGLKAGGATGAETECFADALAARLDQLRAVAY